MSLTQGKCFYSGHNVPIAKGVIHIANDGKHFLVKSDKMWSFFVNKVKPQKVKYTFLSRLFHKKGEAEAREKKTKIQTEKQTSRGFISISRGQMDEILKKSLATAQIKK